MNPSDIARARRARLYEALIPRLYKGAYIPKSATIARALGVSACTANSDIRWVLRRAGIVTRKVQHPDGGLRAQVQA
jgi:hypothetical protein